MAASSRRDLFVSISGSIDGLATATKAARSVLLDFNQAGGSIVDQINAKMREIGGGAANGLIDAEKTMKATLARIRQDISAAGGDSGALIKMFNVNDLNAQIAKADQAAASNRLWAESAQAVAARGGDTASAALGIAAAFGKEAAESEQAAAGLRTQAEVLGLVATEAKAAGVAQDSAGTVVAGAHARMGASGMILQHVVRSTTDSFVAGLPPAMIFGEQIGRVGEAAALSGGSFGKFGEFMSGPWGIAVTAGIGLLSALIPKLLDSGDAVEKGVKKLKDDAAASDVADRARAAFKITTEGLIDTQRQLNKELDKSIETQRSLAQATLQSAEANVAAQQTDRAALAQQLAAADARVKVFQARMDDPHRDPDQTLGINAGLISAKRDAANLRDQIAQVDGLIVQGQGSVRVAQGALAKRDQAMRADDRTRVDENFTNETHTLDIRLKIGPGKSDVVPQYNFETGDVQNKSVSGIGIGDYRREYAAADARHRAEIARIEAAEKAKRDSERPTRDPTSSSSALLASAERYRGDTEGGTGRSSLMQLFSSAGISIDPKITAWCAAFVNAVLATNGLHGTGSLSAKSFLDYGSATNSPQKGDIVVLNRKGGGHVGFFEGYDKKGDVRVLGGNTGNKVSVETFSRAAVLGYRRAPGSAQGVATSAESAADKEVNRQKAFDDQFGRAQADNLRAQLALARGTEDQVGIQLGQIAAEKAKADADVKAGLATGKLLPAEAEQLLALNRSTEYLEGVAVLRAEQHRQLEQAVQDGRDELDRQASLLDLQGSMARTQKERLAIALQLLAIDEKKRRQAAALDIASDDPARIKKGIADLNQIDAEQPYREAQARRQYASPLEQYRQQLRDATGDMDSSLEQIAAHGMSDLNDQVSQTIEKFLGLHGVMGTIIGDFIRLAAQRAELSLLDRLMGGGSSKSITSLGSALGSLFGHATGHVPGFAAGLISGPGTGTSDSILGWMEGRGLIKVSAGESIMTAEATRQHGPLLKAMNDNALPRFATGMVPANLSYPSVPSAASLAPVATSRMLTFDLRGAVVSEDLLRQMESIANDASIRVVTDSAPTIISAAADHTLARFGRPRL